MKDKEIKLRMTTADHLQLTQAAQQLGMPLAVYILSAALEKIHQQQPLAVGTSQQPLPEIPTEALAKRSIKTGYYSTTSKATAEQLAASLVTITRTELEDRLKSTQTSFKAHTIPAQLKKLPVTSLAKYTSERDPDNKAWIPANQDRTIWATI